jgi:hypothetical protein
MRLAIPEHRDRVAPVFDSCRRLLVFQQDEDTDNLLDAHDWSAVPRMARASCLKELMIELLVCGGVSRLLEDEVGRHGIDVIPWVAGEVTEILEALRRGTISDPCYTMPGRGFCRGRRLCGRRQKKKGQAQNLFEKGV